MSALPATASALYAPGASYVKYTATNIGDRYTVFDCAGATTDANVSPCRTATTLTSVLSAGISSNDGTIHRLADGNVVNVGGVSARVATAPRPQSSTFSTTIQYRIYFELNGNVYTGALIKDGAALGGNAAYVSNASGTAAADRLTFLPFHIKLNKAAHDSLAAAMAI